MFKHLIGFAVAATLMVQPVLTNNASANEIEYSANRISADLVLDNGMDLQLSISFAQAIGLNEDNVNLTVQALDPNDHRIVNRLPDNFNMWAVDSFPVLISVQPRKDKGFSFSGEAEIELYTQSIEYADNIRLFRSHAGGEFEDITTLTAAGSLRARGSTGHFSDFILLVDNRDGNLVAAAKARDLANYLYNHVFSMEDQFGNEVQALTRNINEHVQQGRYQAAASNLNNVLRKLESAHGNSVPGVWRSSGDIENVQGELITKARSLRFTLGTLLR
ncbi:hypothetical protein A28LD_1182 [Idiomarina sp. A28L]|uniref:DUF6689 family protein n=1 Tax=Idiomarina sp. A28L TaxID=1036674 RepID=UPI0002138E53|nr:DUF6689 family protein [Idiomarina sp. A28L]EGN75569.1 hypothetical protein A28LD_1182 [Idiomarina sp. A28L]